MNDYKTRKLIESDQRDKIYQKLTKYSKRTIGNKRSKLLKEIDTEVEKNNQSIVTFNVLEELSKNDDASQYATILSELFGWNININNDKRQVTFSRNEYFQRF